MPWIRPFSTLTVDCTLPGFTRGRNLEKIGHHAADTSELFLEGVTVPAGEVLGRYSTIVVPELNSGQLSRLLRAEFLVDAHPVSKVEGQPFSAAELTARISEVLR